MENEEESTPLEVLAPSAIMAMEKAQIDIQISTAHQYPRSLEKFRARAMAMATLDPETAESCIYVRNVGKAKNEKTGKWEEKFAEGPSIRLAEIVAVSYGNLRAASKVVEQTERYVKCTGMAHDLESNTAMSADVIESTVKSDGTPYSERQRALVAKVCGAKAIRDAILKVVPRALCKPIMEGAKRVAHGLDRPIEERRKKAQAWIATLRVSEDRVLAALGVKEWAAVNSEHLTILTGLKTAMADGDETIDSAFPKPEATAESQRPVQTAHQQATQGAVKATEPAKTAAKKEEDNVRMDLPDGAKAPRSVPEPTNPAETAAAAQTPAEPAPAATESAKSEAATPENPPAESTEPPDPALNPATGDSDSIASVKLLAQKSGVNWFQLQTYLLAHRLMRAEQKQLAELATSKLDNIARNFAKWLPDIKKLPRSA